MVWTKQLLFIGLILISKVLSSLGQEMELGVNVNPGLAYTGIFDPGMNGFSLDADYLHSPGEKLTLKGGVEIGVTGWGSQLLVATGFRYGDQHQVEVEIVNGMALYQQGPKYVVGAGAYYCASFFQGKKNQLLVSTGLRYSIQPAYKEFSNIYSYIDLPLRIRWVRSFKREK